MVSRRSFLKLGLVGAVGGLGSGLIADEGGSKETERSFFGRHSPYTVEVQDWKPQDGTDPLREYLFYPLSEEGISSRDKKFRFVGEFNNGVLVDVVNGKVYSFLLDENLEPIENKAVYGPVSLGNNGNFVYVIERRGTSSSLDVKGNGSIVEEFGRVDEKQIAIACPFQHRKIFVEPKTTNSDCGGEDLLKKCEFC